MRRETNFVTRFLRFGAAMGGMAILAACANTPPPAPATTSSQSQQPTETTQPQPTGDPNAPVVLALLAPTTASGKRTRAAAQDLTAAAQMARRDHGPANMAMKVYDTKGTPEGAAEAAAQAVAEGAAVILGPLRSSSTAAIGPIAAAAGVNVLSLSNDASVAGGNVWVLGQLPGEELRRVMSYAASQGVGAVAVAYPTNRYGELIANEASNAGSSIGVSVGPYVPYERSFQGIERATKDGAPAIRGQADGVLIADAGDALRSAAAFLSYYDVSPRNVKYLGTSRWADLKNTKENALIGGWFAGADPDLKSGFDNRFQAAMGRAPSPLAGLAYEAVQATADMLRAASQAGDNTPFDVDAITDPRGHTGVAGAFRLLTDGRNQRSLAVLEVTETGFFVVDAGQFGGGS